MNVHLNGKSRQFDDVKTLYDLIRQNIKNSAFIVAEMNGEIIGRDQWPNKFINDGDKVELVSPVAGG